MADRDVIVCFVEEVRGYLPALREAVGGGAEAFEEAQRHLHTIKGASSMLKFADLAATAATIEHRLRQIEQAPDDEAGAAYLAGIDRLDAQLGGLLGDDLANPPLPGGDSASVEPPPAGSLGVDEPDDQDVPPEFVEVFRLEAEEHLRAIATALPALEASPGDKDRLQSIRRVVHTLKGAAGMVGYQAVSQLAHRLEDLLDRLYDAPGPVPADRFPLLFRSADALEDLAQGKKAAALEDLYAQYDAALGEAPPGAPSPPAAAPAPAREPDLVGGEQTLRVPLRRLDELVNLVSELVVARATFEQRLGEYERQLEELQPSTDRLRRVSSKLERQYEARALLGGRLAAYGPPRNGARPGRPNGHGFDPLELDRYSEFHLLSRELAETTSDVQGVGGEFRRLLGDFESYLTRQRHLTADVEDRLMRLRLVPLAGLATRLHRTVRHVAAPRNKQVALVIDGGETELDKGVLEEIADPLLHLLRNAVDHGIEVPEARQAQGKPAQGVVCVWAGYEGGQVVIRVADDGAGLNPAALRATGVARGLLSEADAAAAPDDELYSLIFRPGFSTAAQVTEISGRGVGLDVVRAQVHKLKGQVAVDSRPGEGTTFTIRLPMTLAMSRVIFVKANQETFALPFECVRQILRVSRDQRETLGKGPAVQVDGRPYPVVELGKALGLRNPPDLTVKRPPVLIVNAGGRDVALEVDQLLGGHEVVVKPLSEYLPSVHGVTGATLTGDGRVVLILNPAELVEAAPVRPPAMSAPEAAPAGDPATVLVVDDSPSVRRVLSTLLQRNGWTVATARDGLEALELLQQPGAGRLPALILLDVEMPRMDGYELLQTVRGHPAFGPIPVVMLTSRAADKHRSKAMEAGANAYLVKPYQEDQLLKLVHQYAGRPRALAVS